MVNCHSYFCCISHCYLDRHRYASLTFAVQSVSRERSKLISEFSSVILGINSVALLEWFAASVVLLVVVTLIYMFVLSRSPPPEKLTQLGLEAKQNSAEVPELLVSADSALLSGDVNTSIDLSVKAAALMLAPLLGRTGVNLSNMNISDLAYLVQSKSQQSPDITQHLYNLNLLRLKAAQGLPITKEEAEWAIVTVRWLLQLTQGGQIRL